MVPPIDCYPFPKGDGGAVGFGEMKITKQNIGAVLCWIDRNWGGLSDDSVKKFFEKSKKKGTKLQEDEIQVVKEALTEVKSIQETTITHIVNLFSDKEESQEKMKTPELESDNHKIDFGLSEEEKKSLKVGETKNGVTKEEILAYFHVGRGNITVLKKQIDGAKKDAFVREYVDLGVKSERYTCLAGEQLFNRNAVFNLGLQDRLPSYEQMEKIRGGKEKQPEFVRDNFQKGIHDLFPGHFNAPGGRFGDIGKRIYCLLSDGYYASIQKGLMKHVRDRIHDGASIRFLKK